MRRNKMASNSYAELTTEPVRVAPDKTFLVMLDDGKRTYAIAGRRTSSMPTLDDIEENGRPCNGWQIAHELETAHEAKTLDFGNSNKGFWMRHGARHAYIIPLNT